MSAVEAIRGRDSTGAMVKSPIAKCALGQVLFTNVLTAPGMVPGTG